MKKYCAIFISMLFVKAVNAQTTTPKQDKTRGIILNQDLPIKRNTVNSMVLITRKDIRISSDPIPKAEPASVERTKRKQPGTFKEFKTN